MSYRDESDDSKARAKCAIFGVMNCDVAARTTYYGLHALQHRGQESAGIAAQNEKTKQIKVHKDFGLVLDVFNDVEIFDGQLAGRAAIGHTRYSTSGSDKSQHNIQPFIVHYKRGHVALSHNGNLTNYRQLRQKFIEKGTLLHSTSDSEVVLHLMAQSTAQTEADQLKEALCQLEGAFSFLVMTATSMYAVRDPNGFRPLCLGKLEKSNKDGTSAYCLASETCAFDLVGAKFIREIEPGEVLVMDMDTCKKDGQFSSFKLPAKFGLSPCVFEFIYFSRPDSYIFGAMVDTVRQHCGVQLARETPVPEVAKDAPPVSVIAVPDSSNTAALGYQRECQRLGFNCSYEIGLIRNHYVGRTFITPNQDMRTLKVRCKFNTVQRVIKDRIVVLVDDSIVRGTTSQQLIKMVRNAGAKEVHFRVASPPVIGPCFYGMDFPSRKELFANGFKSEKEMAEWLGCDSLAFLSAKGLRTAVADCNTAAKTYCEACFTDKYPVPIHEEVESKTDW